MDSIKITVLSAATLSDRVGSDKVDGEGKKKPDAPLEGRVRHNLTTSFHPASQSF
jgi:hypothetical protein